MSGDDSRLSKEKDCVVKYKERQKEGGENPAVSAKLIARKVFPSLISGGGVNPDHLSRTC